MPQPPPAASPPLTKFILHAPPLTAPSSPLSLASSTSAGLAPSLLLQIRQALIHERQSAVERLATRNANKSKIAERQAREKRIADQLTAQKEADRVRRKEEAARVDRELRERHEREREREKKEQEELFERKKVEEEREMRRKDEVERERLVSRAREMKEAKEAKEVKEAKEAQERDQAKRNHVLQIVRENEAKRLELATTNTSVDVAPPSPPPPPLPTLLPISTARIAEDVAMPDAVEDTAPHGPVASVPTPVEVKPPIPSLHGAELQHQIKVEPTPISLPSCKSKLFSHHAARHLTSSLLFSDPSIKIVESPEPEDEQPLALPRHKSAEMKKRKHDRILDSDASDSDEQASQPLMNKLAKFNDHVAHPTASPSPAPASTARQSPAESSTANSRPAPPSPPSPKDPYEGFTPLERKLKEEKFIKHSIPTRPPAIGTAQAFYLPSHPLVPPRPISERLAPTPKKQSEVAEDFSKAKPGNQTSHNVFHTWAEAYLRPFGEDDLAILAPKPDDISLYLQTPLGKHYTDRWDEEDSEPAPSTSHPYPSPLDPPVLPRTKPDHLTEDALGMEQIFLGPLSERLVAALAFGEDGESSELKERVERDEEAVQSGKLAVMDAVDLEERVKKELRFIGILSEEDVDWGAREDDEISSALRACQRLLLRQTSLNEARKSVLSSIVKDRMAYQDYETTRDAQERVIENGWMKRQRAGKKKGKGRERDRNTEGGSNKPPVSLALLQAVEKRRNLVEMFKPFFGEEEDKGRFFGIPDESVYKDLGEGDSEELLVMME
ncbi:transcriptional adapter 3, partial [Phenoliferia sp. Uapishka_3]